MTTIGNKEFFKGINKIEFEGKDSKNPLAFKYYNPDQIVAGKTMRDHFKFAAAAIKNYKETFEWSKGFESWSKVPTTEDYHMVAPLIGLEATGAAEIEEIIFGFVNETELKQELVDIVELGSYITCFLKLTTKTGETFDGVEVFQVDEEGRVDKIWAL